MNQISTISRRIAVGARIAITAAFGCSEDGALDESGRPEDATTGQQQFQQTSTCRTMFESPIFAFTQADIDREDGMFWAQYEPMHADIPEESLQSIAVRVREGRIVDRREDGHVQIDWNVKPEDGENNIYHAQRVNDENDENRNDKIVGTPFVFAFGAETYPDGYEAQGGYNIRTHNVHNTVYKIFVETCGLYEANGAVFYPMWCDDPNDGLVNPNAIDPRPFCTTFEEL